MKIINRFFPIIVIGMLFLSCDILSTDEQQRSIKFTLMLETEQGIHGPPSPLSKDLNANQPVSLKKILSEYDNAKIMVIDCSKYKSEDDLFASNEYLAYHEEMENLPAGTLYHWNEQVKLVEHHFPIIANQLLEIGDGHATGYIPGVIGLNRIYVALCQDNYLLYSGGSYVVAEPGLPQQVKIYVGEYH